VEGLVRCAVDTTMHGAGGGVSIDRTTENSDVDIEAEEVRFECGFVSSLMLSLLSRQH